MQLKDSTDVGMDNRYKLVFMKIRLIYHNRNQRKSRLSGGFQREDKVSEKRYFVFLCRLRGGKIEAGDGNAE